MIIALVGGGPRDGALVEIPEGAGSYYDFREEANPDLWHRYVEVWVPMKVPPIYEYVGCRFTDEWWHK